MKHFFLILLIFLFGCGAPICQNNPNQNLINNHCIELGNRIQHPIPVILDRSVNEWQVMMAINWIENQLGVRNLFQIVNEQPSFDLLGDLTLSTGYVQIIVLNLDSNVGGETDVFSQGSEIVGALVHINRSLTDTNKRYQAVLEHELLHALGLNDDPVTSTDRSIMQGVLIADGSAYITPEDKELVLKMFR